MSCTAVFAHYDRDGALRPYVREHLRALRSVASRVVLVSNAALGDEARAEAERLADRVLLRENLGFDFAMWRDALASESLELDELVLCNSSVLGPFTPLPALFARMREHDFWGPTESTQHTWHLQSYFLVFGRAVVRSEAFTRFFRSVLDYADKEQVIRSYELGLCTYLTQHGFRGASVIALGDVEAAVQRRGLRLPWQAPPSLRGKSAFVCVPDEHVRLGAPFIKVASLADLEKNGTLGELYALAAQAGYPREPIDDARTIRSAVSRT